MKQLIADETASPGVVSGAESPSLEERLQEHHEDQREAPAEERGPVRRSSLAPRLSLPRFASLETDGNAPSG
jgi:hypothetical protein